jgi:hypothetical protein
MWLEAIVSKEDLVAFLPSVLPLKFDLSDGGDVFLHDPSEIALVAASGLRFVCKAKLHYPVLGINVPITVSSVSALIRPHIVKADGAPRTSGVSGAEPLTARLVEREARSAPRTSGVSGAEPLTEKLVFGLELEHADFAGLPELLDTAITHKITSALRERPLELSWSFLSTLSHTFKLPPSLAPLVAIGLHAKWGEVRVTEEALVLAVAVQAEAVRGSEPAA